MACLWQPRADHEQKHELGDVTITRGLDATRPITEALPWQFWIRRSPEAETAVRAALGRLRWENGGDRSPGGGGARLGRPPRGFFFSPPPGGGGAGGRGTPTSSSTRARGRPTPIRPPRGGGPGSPS